jgi:hypothetical protein
MNTTVFSKSNNNNIEPQNIKIIKALPNSNRASSKLTFIYSTLASIKTIKETKVKSIPKTVPHSTQKAIAAEFIDIS